MRHVSIRPLLLLAILTEVVLRCLALHVLHRPSRFCQRRDELRPLQRLSGAGSLRVEAGGSDLQFLLRGGYTHTSHRHDVNIRTSSLDDIIIRLYIELHVTYMHCEQHGAPQIHTIKNADSYNQVANR